MKNVVAKFDSKRRKIRDTAWVVDLRSTKIKTLNGKKVLSRNFFKTQAEAEAFANEVNMAQGTTGVVVSGKADTFAMVADAYIANMKARYEDKKIVFRYFEKCKLHADTWKGLYGNLQITQITTTQVEDALRSWVDDSASYQTARLGVLKNIFKTAITMKILGSNPAGELNIEVQKYNSEDEIEDNFDQEEMYTVENFRSIIDACDIPSDSPFAKEEIVYTPFIKKVLVSFAMQTGLRFGEQAALRWKHINFDKKIVYVRVAVREDKNGSVTVSIPKTIKSGKKEIDNKQRRVVPVPPSLIKLLKEWRLKSDYSGQDDLVFPKPDGTHRKNSDKWNANVLTPLCKKAGVNYFSWHKMRHFYASLMISMHGCEKIDDLLKVSARLGHASLDFTYQTYAHMIENQEQDDDDGEAMDEALFGTR